eukprot:TRINITY_DN2930_c0_g1_i2.p1 TRINITY_DN2930_c0_g1~~TRINITY_DN2930_c0_g1_i2.p1  ORF type:complete len:1305 (+),score=536.42 TRINITY_DN2930_c0_g1_i2:1720-5634(+)
MDHELTKPVLLRWMSDLVCANCFTLTKLKDGALLVKLFAKVFPLVVQLDVVEWVQEPADDDDVLCNFDVLRETLEAMEIPTQILDVEGITNAEYQPCYNLLVLLYFIYHHAHATKPTKALLATPLPNYLTEFISSPMLHQVVAASGLTMHLKPHRGTVPQIGALVEAFGMTGNSDLNGIRGRMLGEGTDGTRVLVEFPPPHGAMLVLPANLRTVAPPKDPPPTGAFVKAVEMMGDPLNGQVGEVLGQQVASDGLRVLVQFSPPHGLMLVRPSNLEITEAPAPAPVQPTIQVGEIVEVVNAPPHLRGAQGRVIDYQHTGEGMMAVVNFEPHQVLYLNPSQLVVSKAQSVSPQQMHSASPSPQPQQRLITQEDLEKIKHYKESQEVDILKRENSLKLERIQQLEATLSRAGLQVNADIPINSQVLWKDTKAKVKGEALITRLTFEIKQLQRLLQLAREEKRRAVEASDESIAKMKAFFDREKALHQEQLTNQLHLADLGYSNKIVELQAYFAAELKRVSAEVKFEDDIIRQGGADCGEAIEEELLRLRQRKVSEETLLQAMEKTNASLKDLADQYKERAQQEEQKCQAAYEHCRSLLQGLLPMQGEGGRHAGDGESPMQCLLQGTPLTPRTLREAVVAHVNSGAPPAALVNDLLAMGLRIRQLVGEKAQLETEKEAEVEGLKLRLFKHEQNDTGADLQRDFEKDEEISRLNDKLEKMKKTVEFLREKEQRLEEHDPYYTMPSPRAPSFDGLPVEQEFDTICSEVNYMLHQHDIEALKRYFWLIIGSHSAMQKRMTQSVRAVTELQNKQEHLVSEVAEERTLFERRLVEMSTNQKIALEEATMAISRDRAEIQIDLNLTKEQLQQAQIMLRELPENHLQNATLTLQADEARFLTLHKKNKGLQSALGRSRLRENLLLQLNQKQQDYFALLMNGEDASDVAKQKQKRELDELVKQLNQLPPIDEAAGVPMDEVDKQVHEAVHVAKNQIANMQRSLQAVMDLAENSATQAKDIDVEKRSLQFALENEQMLREKVKAECNAIADEKAELRKLLRERDMKEAREVLLLKEKLRTLEENKQTLLMFEEVRELLCLSKDSPARRKAVREEGGATPPGVVGLGRPSLEQLTGERRTPPAQHRAPAVPPVGGGIGAAAVPMTAVPAVPVVPAVQTVPGGRSAGYHHMNTTPPGEARMLTVGSQGNHVDRTSDKSMQPLLHAKINEAKKQIEDILASTRSVGAVPQLAKTSSSRATLPPPPLPRAASILDDAEFAKQRNQLLESFGKYDSTRSSSLSMPTAGSVSPKNFHSVRNPV